jgi:hypothetical protein
MPRLREFFDFLRERPIPFILQRTINPRPRNTLTTCAYGRDSIPGRILHSGHNKGFHPAHIPATRIHVFGRRLSRMR